MSLLRVGLTGNIASGKSAVGQVWRRLGAPVLDADVLAREAVALGTPGLQAVVAAFGPGILEPSGLLDRAALRRIVFQDAEARRRLEAIVHPEVQRLRRAREEQLAQAGARVVVHDIPLLYEVGAERELDLVVLVDAPEEVRLRRLLEHRGLPEAEARAMIAAQMPAAEKRDRADMVIDNDGTLAELAASAGRAWEQILERLNGATGATGASGASASA